MSTIKNRIADDLKSAMRSQDKQTLSTLRLIMAAFKQIEVDERIELDDERVLVVLDKLAKQRRESIEQYQKASRQDLIDVEEFELGVIQQYLPEQLSEDEINQLIDAAMTETGAASIKDMGKVMAIVKPKAQGRADLKVVSQKIKDRL
jgi:uncharacterized protein